MEKIDLLFQLQSIYDDYKEYEALSAEYEKLNEKGSDKDEEIKALAASYNDSLKVPLIDERYFNDDSLSYNEFIRIRKKLNEDFDEFEKQCRKAKADFNKKKDELIARKEKAFRNEEASIRKQLHSLEDKLHKQKLIDYRHIEMIPAVIREINDAGVASVQDALNSIRSKENNLPGMSKDPTD